MAIRKSFLQILSKKAGYTVVTSFQFFLSPSALPFISPGFVSRLLSLCLSVCPPSKFNQPCFESRSKLCSPPPVSTATTIVSVVTEWYSKFSFFWGFFGCQSGLRRRMEPLTTDVTSDYLVQFFFFSLSLLSYFWAFFLLERFFLKLKEKWVELENQIETERCHCL